MKKILCALLAAVLLVTTFGVAALAEGEQPLVVVDGVKDATYSDKKMLDYVNWQFFDNNGQGSFEPVDVERAKNTVWFNWDDTHVYIYFQCESKDDLYKPAADETEIPDFDEVFYEIAQIYLDTAPSAAWNAPCIWAGQDGNGDFCAHMACACREGAENCYYRLMARANPAWGGWNDYYFSAAGMFMDYDTFCEKYTGREGCEDLAAAYKATHGEDGSAAVSFIDYTTNTYGFELKFPRLEGEEYFQFNIRTRVDEKVWDEEGPELPYTLSFCPAWWTNSDGLMEIWFDDYEEEIDPAVAAFRRMQEQLPALDSIGLEHKTAVLELNHHYVNMTDTQKAGLTVDEVAFIESAVAKIGALEYVANLGNVNSDDKINANDALIVLRAAVGKVELDADGTARADVNADQKLDAKDALEILKFAVGKITEFPAARAVEL